MYRQYGKAWNLVNSGVTFFSALLTSLSASALFSINAFSSLKDLDVVPEDPLDNFNKVNNVGKILIVTMLMMDLIMFLSMLKTNSRLVRRALNLFHGRVRLIAFSGELEQLRSFDFNEMVLQKIDDSFVLHWKDRRSLQHIKQKNLDLTARENEFLQNFYMPSVFHQGSHLIPSDHLPQSLITKFSSLSGLPNLWEGPVDMRDATFWSTPLGKRVEFSLALPTALYMSTVIGININSLMSDFSSSARLNLTSSLFTFAGCLYALSINFLYKNDHDGNNQMGRYKKILFSSLNATASAIYALGSALLFFHTIALTLNYYQIASFSMNLVTNSSKANKLMVPIFFCVTLPTFYVLGQAYHAMCKKRFGLVDVDSSSGATNSAFDLYLKVYVALARSAVLALSLNITADKIWGRANGLFLLTAVITLFTFVADFISRLALYFASEDNVLSRFENMNGNVAARNQHQRTRSFAVSDCLACCSFFKKEPYSALGNNSKNTGYISRTPV